MQTLGRNCGYNGVDRIGMQNRRRLMARPSKPKKVCGEPRCRRFFGEIGKRDDFYIAMTVEEYETVRLIDYLGKTQEECAASMGVGRATVQMLYAEARKKLARFLVEGAELEISGGDYVVCPLRQCRQRRISDREEEHLADKNRKNLPGRSERSQKGAYDMIVAVTYENGEVFQHFGHTEEFKIYQVEDGRIVSSRVVGTNGSGHGALAGFLKDQGVDVLICGGIGGGARNALADAGIQLLGGACGNADAQVESYLAGKLHYDPDVQCSHHGHEGGSCGEHGHHEGGGCGEHGCHE